jgi:hypothetical protein
MKFCGETLVPNNEAFATSVILSEAKDLANIVCGFVRSLASARDDRID